MQNLNFCWNDIIGGVVASITFAVLTGIIYWLIWLYNSWKFSGTWEHYNFNENEELVSKCSADEIRGTRIRIGLINPKKLIAKCVTFESSTYRTWKGNYVLTATNYASGEYIYSPDKFRPQWGTHELRTQSRDDGKYMLLTVKDGGLRGFNQSGQLLKKVSKKVDKEKFDLIKSKLKGMDF